MEVTIFHKTLVIDIRQDLESRYLMVCDILEKEEDVIRPQLDNIDMNPEDGFPLIALSAVTRRMKSSYSAKEPESTDEMRTLSINLPSFNNISEVFEYKIMATPFHEQYFRAGRKDLK